MDRWIGLVAGLQPIKSRTRKVAIVREPTRRTTRPVPGAGASPSSRCSIVAPGKGLLRGLRCTSAAASQAIAPETPRPPADWRGLGCAAASQAHRRKRRGPQRTGAGLGARLRQPRLTRRWARPGVPRSGAGGGGGTGGRGGRRGTAVASVDVPGWASAAGTCGARRGYRSPPRPPRWTAWWRRTRRWPRDAAPRPTGRAGRYALALPLSLCSLRIRSWMQDSASIRSY